MGACSEFPAGFFATRLQINHVGNIAALEVFQTLRNFCTLIRLHGNGLFVLSLKLKYEELIVQRK